MSSLDPKNADLPCLVLHSKLNEFRASGKHCNVAVKVEERIFKAHRVVLASACGYFDTLFSAGFRDSFEDTVVLSDIDTTAFECLLEYAYLGIWPKISSSNVLSLLCASEYLDVAEIKNCCVDYILFPGNMAMIENFFQLFEYSFHINNLKLVDSTLDYLVKNFNILSQDENFLLLSFDQLNMVLKKYELLARSLSDFTVFKHNNAHFILDAIVRWVCYRSNKRRKHFDELKKFIDFEEISEAYIEFLSKEYELNLSRSKTACDDKSVLLKDYLEKYFNSDDEIVGSNNCESSIPYEEFCSKNLYSLNLYYSANCYFDQEEVQNTLHVYTVDKFRPYGYLRNITRNCESSYSKCMKIIASEEPNYYIYCLDNSSPFVFTRYTKITLEDGCQLTSPPFTFTPGPASIDMCEMQNVIYLYTPSPKLGENPLEFSKEELSRKVWCYNCELDKWFPTPLLHGRIQYRSRIVTDNTLIYLIGFKGSSHGYTKGYVHIYDNRASKWQTLLHKERKNDLCDGVACCCLNGKIYASNTDTVSALNVVAAKWETLSCNEQKDFCMSGKIEMASYQNKLWMIHYRRDCLYATIYDPYTTTWCNSKFLDREFKEKLDSMFNGSSEYNNYFWHSFEIVVSKSQH